MNRIAAALITLLLILPAIGLLGGCQRGGSLLREHESVTVLDRDYRRLMEVSRELGPGGAEVLRVAYEVLREGRAEGRWRHVGLEDLWAHAIKEGRGLFDRPELRWGMTSAEMTGDMLGQTTIGPWQITLQSARDRFGPMHGVDPNWSDEQVYGFLANNPPIQVRMILDLIQRNYDDYGERSPYAIQAYFWFEGFVRGDIGQGRWDASVLARGPEAMRQTGFYGKQILLGTEANPYSLLYFLAVTGKEDEIRETLLAWKRSPNFVWNAAEGRATRQPGDGRFTIRPQHLTHLRQFPREFAIVNRIVGEVIASTP